MSRLARSGSPIDGQKGPLEVLGSPETLSIRSEADLVSVRQAVRRMSGKAHLGLVDQTRIVTAASELARNVYVHAGAGTLRIEAVKAESRDGIRLLVEDHGPGIPDLELALTPGYSTGGGLGLGLSGTMKLVDQFEIESEPGRGTSVLVVKWR